jgi:hypothetical protein
MKGLGGGGEEEGEKRDESEQEEGDGEEWKGVDNNKTFLCRLHACNVQKIFSHFIQTNFWVVTPCSDVLGYRRFGGPCCLRLQDNLSMSDLYNALHLWMNP